MRHAVFFPLQHTDAFLPPVIHRSTRRGARGRQSSGLHRLGARHRSRAEGAPGCGRTTFFDHYDFLKQPNLDGESTTVTWDASGFTAKDDDTIVHQRGGWRLAVKIEAREWFVHKAEEPHSTTSELPN